MKRTFYIFMPLILLSWSVEFGIGIPLLQWYWGTAWYRVGWFSFLSESMSATIANVLNTVLGLAHISVSPVTTANVVTGLVVLFVGVHVLYAFWYGILGPVRERWHLGARKPSLQEQDMFHKAVSLIVSNAHDPISPPRTWRVADGMGLQSRWVGYVLILDRELIQHRFFPAVLAHELGHSNSEDRLARRFYAMLLPVRSVVAIFGGVAFGLGHALLYPIWAWYWRERIYAADAFAAQVGQGYNLIRALEFYQKLDQMTHGGRVLKPVPYVEQRIDRLRRLLVTSRSTRYGEQP